MKKRDLTAYKENGKFLAIAWPGGYPLYYLDEEGNILCPDCANKEEMSMEVIAADVNWEDEGLFCDDCSKQIHRAYGNDEEEAE